MIKRKIEEVKEQILEVQCDSCKRTIDDAIEISNFHHINFTAGFGSSFGDMNKVSADICDTCFHDLISSFANISDQSPPVVAF